MTGFRRKTGRRRTTGTAGLLALALALALTLPTAHAPDASAAPPPAGAAADPATPEHGGSAFGWSLLVHGIQKALREAGYLNGPVTGRLTSATDAAIRAYQGAHDLAVDGRPTDALLQHLSTVGVQQALQNKLATARREQIAAATEALEGAPETRDLLAGNLRDAPADPNRDRQRCFTDVRVACFLEEASETIKTLKQDVYRDWSLRDLVVAEAAAGRVEAARAGIRRLQDVRLKLAALRDMAIALANAGHLEEARETAAIVPDAPNRAQAYAALAAAEAKAPGESPVESISYMLEASFEIDAPLRAVDILADAAAALHAAGAVDEAGIVAEQAFTLARRLTDEGERAMALAGAANALLSAGRADAALAAMAGPGGTDIAPATADLTPQATVLADGRIAPGLLQAAERAGPDLRPLALANIAHVHADLGDVAGARQILEQARKAIGEMERRHAADAARARIGATMLTMGDDDGAAAVAEAIHDDRLRARTLWQFAHSTATNPARHADWRRRAVHVTDAIDSPFDRASILCDAAAAEARQGRHDSAADAFADALAAAKALDTGWWRARILSRVAATLQQLTDAGVRIAP